MDADASMRGGVATTHRTASSRQVQQSARTPHPATAVTVGYVALEIAARANTRTSSVRLSRRSVLATLQCVAASSVDERNRVDAPLDAHGQYSKHRPLRLW